ncbi:hypothetical protein [Hydrogenimonas cancrithermarum]|nr:hypothetical protein [Hydrogenimonas cancrithermarum]
MRDFLFDISTFTISCEYRRQNGESAISKDFHENGKYQYTEGAERVA